LEEEILSINRIQELGINRKTIKPVIMNKPYNATNRTLVSYIRDLLVWDHKDEYQVFDDMGNIVLDNNNKPKFDYIY